MQYQFRANMSLSLTRFTLLFTLGLLVALGGRACFTASNAPHFPCFYYWKTTLNADSTAWQQLTRISGHKPLYLRVFDVDYHAGYRNAVPVGDLSLPYAMAPTDGRVVVPTVFITNRVFEQLNDSMTVLLAEKIHRRITRKFAEWEDPVRWVLVPETPDPSGVLANRRDSSWGDWYARCNEIQIDCDWTAATRDRYFHFLRALRTHMRGEQLSCTIRLHQYRDRVSAGIPPVDWGMLMCYNVAEVSDETTQNAVFDAALVKGYLKAPRYPLRLDVALPLFGWGAWFREGQFRGLLDDWHPDPALFEPEGQQRFRVKMDTVLGRDYLREGDLIRADAPAAQDLVEISALLGTKVRGRDSRLVFFDWQTDKISRYEKTIQACVDRFW
jgi:hypothetical protein